MRSQPANTVAILPLRNGSKGLPRKNLRLLSGKPLYQHTLDQAVRTIGQCLITTDIPEIISADTPNAATVIQRPLELAEDITPMTPVLFHLFEHLQQACLKLPDVAVLLQATSPLRSDDDIREAISLYAKGDFDLVMSVTRSDSTLLKHGILDDGKFIPVSDPAHCFANRQQLPKTVRPNGAIYVFSPKTFLRNGGFASANIGAMEMPENRSIDIDNSADLIHAETIISDQHLQIAS